MTVVKKISKKKLKKDNKTPLVSVIINFYNGEKFLKESIDSVINQKYKNLEIILWDNHSSDKSSHIVKNYNDSRIKYFYSDINTTLYKARNLAFKKSNGDFIMFLDCDDVFLNNCIESQLKLFEDPEVEFACANYFCKYEQKNKQFLRFKRKKPEGYVLSDLLKDYSVGLLTLIIRRKILKNLNPLFNYSYNYIGDFDLVVRLAAKYKMARNNEPLGIYRIHDKNLSYNNYYTQAIELENWYKESKKNKLISSNENFKNILNLVNFKKLIHHIIKKNMKDFFYYFKKVPWSLRKLKLLFIFIVIIIFRRSPDSFKM